MINCYSEFDPIGDTESYIASLEIVGGEASYSEFDPIGDTESYSDIQFTGDRVKLQRVRSDRGY